MIREKVTNLILGRPVIFIEYVVVGASQITYRRLQTDRSSYSLGHFDDIHSPPRPKRHYMIAQARQSICDRQN